MDWSNSFWGFLVGLLVFLINMASLVAFFSITSTDESKDEYMSKVVNAVTNFFGTGAVFVGLKASMQLVEKVKPEPALMDRWTFALIFDDTILTGRFLLKVGVFFIMVYTCFTITIGVFPSGSENDFRRMKGENGDNHGVENVGEERMVEDIPGELHVIAGILNLVQVR